MAQKLITMAATAVTTAGTRVQVTATDIWVSSILVSAPAANTGNVYVGDSNVSATRGIEMPKGTSREFRIVNNKQEGEFNLSDVYIDAATSGDKVMITYVKARN